jgi:hypothetical protein
MFGFFDNNHTINASSNVISFQKLGKHLCMAFNSGVDKKGFKVGAVLHQLQYYSCG